MVIKRGEAAAFGEGSCVNIEGLALPGRLGFALPPVPCSFCPGDVPVSWYSCGFMPRALQQGQLSVLSEEWEATDAMGVMPEPCPAP